MEIRKLAEKIGEAPLIIFCGLPGVGKTFVAKKLSKEIGALHLCTDKIRQELFPARTYSKEESGAVHAKLLKRAETLLKKRKKVILEATFLNTYGRKKAYALAKKLKIPFKVVYVTASDKTVEKRLKKGRRKEEFSEADFEVYKKMKKRLKKGADYSLPTEDEGVEVIVFVNED